MNTIFNIAVPTTPVVVDRDPDPTWTNCVKKIETDDYI
jgi:hypothetical protein